MDPQEYQQFIYAANLVSDGRTSQEQRGEAEKFIEDFHQRDNSIEYYFHILTTSDPGILRESYI